MAMLMFLAAIYFNYSPVFGSVALEPQTIL